MRIKSKTYYIIYYNKNINDYDIIYTDNKWVYVIATKHKHVPLIIKYDKKVKWFTIKDWQYDIGNQTKYQIDNKYNVKMEEVSKEEVFLELL